MSKVILIMGSPSDKDFAGKITSSLEKFGIQYECRVASAHKTPKKLLSILEGYRDDSIVYITVAGRSNALSGFVDANTIYPVIACPPYSDDFGGADIYSSLRTPSGVSPLLVLEPENAALAALKILAMGDNRLQEKVLEYQKNLGYKIEKADEEIRNKHI